MQAMTSLINFLNIKELLEKGNFTSPADLKAQGVKKPDSLTVTHLEDGHNFHYKVCTAS